MAVTLPLWSQRNAFFALAYLAVKPRFRCRFGENKTKTMESKTNKSGLQPDWYSWQSRSRPPSMEGQQRHNVMLVKMFAFPDSTASTTLPEFSKVLPPPTTDGGCLARACFYLFPSSRCHAAVKRASLMNHKHYSYFTTPCASHT